MKHSWAKQRIAASLSAMLLLSACVSNYPDDLRVGAVTMVEWRDQAELPGPGASPLSSLVPTRTLRAMGEPVEGNAKPPRPLLKVELMSMANLSYYVAEKAFTLLNEAHFCDTAKRQWLPMSFLNVFSDGARVGPPDPLRPLWRTEPTGEFVYYIFIDVVRERVAPSTPPVIPYDLRSHAADICVQLHGSDYVLSGFRSNTVTISRSEIEAALSKAPPVADRTP